MYSLSAQFFLQQLGVLVGTAARHLYARALKPLDVHEVRLDEVQAGLDVPRFEFDKVQPVALEHLIGRVVLAAAAAVLGLRCSHCCSGALFRDILVQGLAVADRRVVGDLGQR